MQAVQAQLQQHIPMAGAQMLTGSQATLLGSQPLYIRTAGPIQGQQGMLGMQAVTSAQLKGKVDGQGNVQVLKVVFLALFHYARYSSNLWQITVRSLFGQIIHLNFKIHT